VRKLRILTKEGPQMQGEEALLVVIPKGRPDQSEWLSQSLGNHSTVSLILDRRSGDRRHHAGAHDYERRNGDRRGSSEADAELATGRWVVVARASRLVNFLDADNRAILFLCCEKHVIPCQKCQDTYRLGWISRGDRGTLACPRCGTDLTAIAAAHTQGCHYWANRLTARAPTESGARTGGAPRP
jgi:hypothetical protein